MNEPVDIIIATHNHLENTIEAIQALYDNTDPSIPFRLTIIDDSTDLTPAWVKKFMRQHDNIQFLRPKEKLTCMNQILNIGLKNTTNEYIIYMSNSSKVEPDWLEAAYRFIRQYPEVGAIGFKALYESSTIEHAGMYFEPGMPHHVNFGVGEASHRHTFVREVQLVGWFLVLLRRKAIPREGFEEGYYIGFRGFDDVDNCLRMRKNGWTILYCGLGAAYHKAYATSRADAGIEQFNKDTEENRFRFLARWGVPKSESPTNSI